jgi:hypothetical protein
LESAVKVYMSALTFCILSARASSWPCDPPPKPDAIAQHPGCAPINCGADLDSSRTRSCRRSSGSKDEVQKYPRPRVKWARMLVA